MNNKKQIQAIAIILVAVIALSIGFAAFSATLNIESEASVNPNASDFSVKFSKQQNTLDESDVNATSIIGVNAEALAAKISNANSPTITGLNASFTTPGSSVTYEFYVMNTGSYNAYLRNVNFSASVNGVDFISCKAGDGATPSLVNEACQGINFELTIGDEVYTPQDTEVNQELLKGTSKKVTVKISYETGSALADGPFTVSIGNVGLTYASTSTGEYPQPEAGDEIATTDPNCFISTIPGELSNYVCNGGDVAIPAELEVSKIVDVLYDEDKCVDLALSMGEDSSLCEENIVPLFEGFKTLSQEEKEEMIPDLLYYGTPITEKVSDEKHTITSIGTSAFEAKNLTSVDIPNTVKVIESWAFSTNKLTSVILPNGLEEIGRVAFKNNLLTEITIPDGVTNIYESTFENNRLASVTFGSGLKMIDGEAFKNNLLTEITIPSGVTEIGGSSFANNKLTIITIPDSVTSIHDNAFAYNNITKVTIGTGITTLMPTAFDGGTVTDSNTGEVYGSNKLTNITIYAPKSQVSYSYLSAFTGWDPTTECADPTWELNFKNNPCITWVNG